ncbi:MAG TPA: GAF domain-containing protein [Trichocoleus sp.]|jgi:GAF domain-containing protein
MNQNSLPQPLETVFSESKSEDIFRNLLPVMCQLLQVDRCFLHLRDPETRLHQNFCWRQNPDLPDTSIEGWEPEQEWEKEDPMFAAALRAEDSIFVEDIETASPSVLNREFERTNLGHRALVHAHLRQEGLLWGILQPAVFGKPRVWSDADRLVIHQVVEKLTPIVIHYVKTAIPSES